MITVKTDRWWEGLEVVEARKPLSIYITKKDINGAAQADVNNCVFSRAIHRMFEDRRVSFFKTVAYVELPQSKGPSLAMRYALPNAMSAVIELFDKTGQCPIDGFTMYPPSPCQTLIGAAKARKQRKLNSNRGHYSAARKRKLAMHFKSNRLVRSGTGHVRFKLVRPPTRRLER